MALYFLAVLVDRDGLQTNVDKKSWYGVLDLLHCWQAIVDGVYTSYGEHGTILLGAVMGESLVSRL